MRRSRLDLQAREAFARWQRQLAPSTQAELRRLRAHRPPELDLVGHVVDREAEREHRMWTRDLREYVSSHEEVGFFLQERRYHICRAHAAARAVIASGTIPAAFACPLHNRACPLAGASALAGGGLIHLRPVMKLALQRRGPYDPGGGQAPALLP
jgi:hypothetical protein